MDRRLAGLIESLQVSASLDQALGQAGPSVDDRKMQRRVFPRVAEFDRLPLAKQPVDRLRLARGGGKMQWRLAKRCPGVQLQATGRELFQQLKLAASRGGVGHRPTVSGLGLRVGILRHEPLRDFGFAKAKREVQRGISQFILRVDINLRGQLRLGFREVTTQHGEVDFHEAVVALEVCGIMPGQAGAGGRTLCLFLRLISLDRIEAKRRIQLVVVKINFARAGVGDALAPIRRQPITQRNEKRRDRKKHNK